MNTEYELVCRALEFALRGGRARREREPQWLAGWTRDLRDEVRADALWRPELAGEMTRIFFGRPAAN